jgi:aspartyl-tRNA(Asn)/glutamyl-tRNA(Gln) amidotransferase subunit A
MHARELSIAEAAAAMDRRELTAVELMNSVLERIEQVNDHARALIHVRPARDLLDEARNRDLERARVRVAGTLHGIPIALKANFQCAGLPTSAGSLILRDWVPDEDAETVAHLRAAGAIVIAMANMHEFADGPTGLNPHFGTPINPRDPARMPGGSSSGSAVALALDMCLGATGTDTGGSIRIPSAFCGVVGMKPTLGLVSTAGVFPFSRTLDHAGPMARTVDDAEILLHAMCGEPARRMQSDAGSGSRPLTGLRIGVDEAYFSAVLDPGVHGVFEQAIERLGELGATVQALRLSRVEASLDAEVAILFPEAAVVHERWLDERAGDYAEDVCASLMTGRVYTATDYVRAQATRAAIRAELDAAFESVDVLATPTAILEAPHWGPETVTLGDRRLDMLDAIIRCTAPFNLSGHPAISVPCGLGDGGTPVGLQLVGPSRSESLLIRIARHVESLDATANPRSKAGIGRPFD